MDNILEENDSFIFWSDGSEEGSQAAVAGCVALESAGCWGALLSRCLQQVFRARK